jgi:hypothetical protein
MPVRTDIMTCPLCGTTGAITIYKDESREYRQCSACRLVFVPSNLFLSFENEKERYDYHQNSPDDPEYRGFLGRLFAPLLERLEPGSRGLDFGSGPGPTLSIMFSEAGFPTEIYDCFYAEAPEAFERIYDFITASEVVEHMREPCIELDRLWSILKPGGWLGIMTCLLPAEQLFKEWHYKNDDTHICFFSRPTFEWLATRWRAEIVFPDRDVVLFRKRI